MYKRPGQTGLVDQLDTLQHRINELSRRSGQSPACVVRLAADVWVPDATNVRPITAWKPAAETDPTGMYHYNEGGDTWWQLPNGGRWHILVYTRWGRHGAFNVNLPPCVSTSLVLNSSGTHEPGTYGIAESTAYNYDINTSYPLICEDRVFNQDDRIRINFWAQYGGTVNAQQLQAFTHVVFRYLGAS